MRLALALAALALLAAAAPAQAGHTIGVVPDGPMTLRVLFLTVDTYAPAPTSHVDGAWVQVCAATAGQPAGCTYTPRQCTPNDLAILCST